MKKGHSTATVSHNIREKVKAGMHPKQAIASSLASARKYKGMAMGGYVEGEDEDDGSVDSAADAGAPGQPVYPMDHDDQGLSESVEMVGMLAKALQAQKYGKNDNSVSYKADAPVMGKEMDEPSLLDESGVMHEELGSKPFEDSVEPKKPASMDHAAAGLTDDARKAIEERKRKRIFMQRG